MDARLLWVRTCSALLTLLCLLISTLNRGASGFADLHDETSLLQQAKTVRSGSQRVHGALYPETYDQNRHADIMAMQPEQMGTSIISAIPSGLTQGTIALNLPQVAFGGAATAGSGIVSDARLMQPLIVVSPDQTLSQPASSFTGDADLRFRLPMNALPGSFDASSPATANKAYEETLMGNVPVDELAQGIAPGYAAQPYGVLQQQSGFQGPQVLQAPVVSNVFGNAMTAPTGFVAGAQGASQDASLSHWISPLGVASSAATPGAALQQNGLSGGSTSQLGPVAQIVLPQGTVPAAGLNPRIMPSASEAVAASETGTTQEEHDASASADAVVDSVLDMLKSASQKTATAADAKANAKANAKVNAKVVSQHAAVKISKANRAQTASEVAAQEQKEADLAAARNQASEKKERTVAKFAAEKAAAQKVAADAQKVVAEAAAKTAAAQRAAAAAERVVAELVGPDAHHTYSGNHIMDEASLLQMKQGVELNSKSHDREKTQSQFPGVFVPAGYSQITMPTGYAPSYASGYTSGYTPALQSPTIAVSAGMAGYGSAGVPLSGIAHQMYPAVGSTVVTDTSIASQGTYGAYDSPMNGPGVIGQSPVVGSAAASQGTVAEAALQAARAGAQKIVAQNTAAAAESIAARATAEQAAAQGAAVAAAAGYNPYANGYQNYYPQSTYIVQPHRHDEKSKKDEHPTGTHKKT
jgi:hypothetical protein